MPAGRHNRAANKNSVGESIERSQLTNRIEEQDVGVFPEWRGEIKATAEDEIPAACGNNPRCGVEAIGFARRENEECAPPLSLNNIVGSEHNFFFLCNNTSGHEQRPTLLSSDLVLEPSRDRAYCGRLRVVLQVPGDFNAILWRAHICEALGVFGRLCEKLLCVLQSGGEEIADERFPVVETAEGALGNARIGEDDGNAATFGFAKEVGPDFCFHDDYECRPNGFQRFSNRDNPIERKVEDSVG